MPREDITRLLHEMREGDPRALETLLPAVYAELRAIAHRRLTPGARDVVLDTTALVHEAYVRLFDRAPLEWADRRHFFSVAAMAMRQIVIDHARRHHAQKRGGDQVRVDLDVAEIPIDDASERILALDQALSRLSERSERLGRVVELRYYGGLSVEETAEVLDVHPRTVKRDWRKARAILYAALHDTLLG